MKAGREIKVGLGLVIRTVKGWDEVNSTPDLKNIMNNAIGNPSSVVSRVKMGPEQMKVPLTPFPFPSPPIALVLTRTPPVPRPTRPSRAHSTSPPLPPSPTSPLLPYPPLSESMRTQSIDQKPLTGHVSRPAHHTDPMPFDDSRSNVGNRATQPMRPLGVYLLS
jgi:hypothetical protein